MTRVVTWGELLLRLKSPGHERLLQSPHLEASFGGGEANVAVSLALLGRPVSYLTVLPHNALADAALRSLRGYGVDVSGVRRTASGRMGVYFLEAGANQRPSTVLYDREGSALSRVQPGDLAWADLVAGAGWFHVTGITPALSASAAETTLQAVRAARQAGLKVSLDLNYRKKLWNYGAKAPDVLGPLAAQADVLVANEEDLQLGLGLGEGHGVPDQRLTGLVRQRYPQLTHLAVTLRDSRSADRNGWTAVLDGPEGFLQGPRFDIDDIVDRVGGGDSFCAGLIWGLTEPGTSTAQALAFAVAASCLKHSVAGDFNLVTRSEVEALLRGEASGRVQR